jgi:hypothetical protein
MSLMSGIARNVKSLKLKKAFSSPSMINIHFFHTLPCNCEQAGMEPVFFWSRNRTLPCKRQTKKTTFTTWKPPNQYSMSRGSFCWLRVVGSIEFPVTLT